MAQTWERLLFAHWPLPEQTLRPLIPRGLTLQTFEGQAWPGLTPFIVSVLRPRAAPSIPGLAPFPELNVRTYVTLEDKPGVFFFSLDAGSLLAVARRPGRILASLLPGTIQRDTRRGRCQVSQPPDTPASSAGGVLRHLPTRRTGRGVDLRDAGALAHRALLPLRRH
jgi:hypothetical protein